MRFYTEDEVEDKDKQALPINSDVPQNRTAVSAPVKKADSSSNISSESKAKQPANLRHKKLLEKTKKAAAATSKPRPVPAATQPETPEEPEVDAPTAKEPAEDSTAVPRFNLAEKILAEQRRFASGRRRKTGSGGAGGTYAANDTLGAVIREVKDNMIRPVEAASGADGDNPAVRETGGKTAEAAAVQRRLITEIVARDITALCGRRHRESLNK